jgi:hypothetical protein
MYSARLVEVHFWLAISGTVIYAFAMWNSGILQGLMWRTYNENGTLTYSFVESMVAMHPYYIARAFGGLLFLLGAVVGSYNIWMTVRGEPEAASDSADLPEPTLRPSRRSRMAEFHRKIRAQRHGLRSGHRRRRQHWRLCRDRAPVHDRRDSRDAPDMRVYTPLELAGRNYIREGCYACHSQMIRTLRTSRGATARTRSPSIEI